MKIVLPVTISSSVIPDTCAKNVETDRQTKDDVPGNLDLGNKATWDSALYTEEVEKERYGEWAFILTTHHLDMALSNQIEAKSIEDFVDDCEIIRLSEGNRRFEYNPNDKNAK